MLPATRWHAAGELLRVLPEVRGKDRIVSAVRGRRAPRSLANAPITVNFGPGLSATVDVTRDGSFADVFFANYRPPVLVPVLQAVLRPGNVFFDVGANIGLYSLWAAKLVGPQGKILAFEPVPQTGDWLQEILDQNHATNVSVIRKAASDVAGSVTMKTTAHASGLSRVVEERLIGSEYLEVSTLRLDELDSITPPSLVKIDVEGFEGAVVAGMYGLLTSVRPAVVFEAPGFGGGGENTNEVVSQFNQHGYCIWSLTTHGLMPFAPDTFSHNLLALHPDEHEAVRSRLASVRFPRCQNC